MPSTSAKRPVETALTQSLNTENTAPSQIHNIANTALTQSLNTENTAPSQIHNIANTALTQSLNTENIAPSQIHNIANTVLTQSLNTVNTTPFQSLVTKINLNEFSIEQLLKMAEINSFPSKEFYTIIEKKTLNYSPILHFFNQQRYYDNISEMKKPTLTTCKFCGTKVTATDGFPFFSNNYKHLKQHSAYFQWLQLYNNRNDQKIKIKEMSVPLMTLTKFICSSNAALRTLENPYLLKMILPYLGRNFLNIN
jgi:hypothetical protein